MEKRIVTDVSMLPPEIAVAKQRHFQDVFGEAYLEVLKHSPLIGVGEAVLIFEEGGKLAGFVNFKKDIYCIKFRNFSVCPEFRGRGIARLLMEELTNIATEYHRQLWEAGKKPKDIGLMFLKSLVYFDADQDGEAFAFGKFLKKMGFAPCAYNQKDLSEEEVAGIARYREIYRFMTSNLKVFKKKIVDTGVNLKAEALSELMRLTGEARDVVLRGLNWKVGHYIKSGRVSFRYDLCPICQYVGSSAQDDSACKKCPIYITCMEPFRAVGRFKEDYEISAAYFRAVKDFLLSCGGE